MESLQPDSGQDELTSKAVQLDILGPVQIFNVSVANEVPLVVEGLSSETSGDNYIEYLTVPISGSVVNYRLHGSTTVGAQSCIFPRLVFWGAGGDYLGEIEPRYDISGTFEIDLAWPLPDDTVSVTPRITLDAGCLQPPQTVAICSASVIGNQ
ncbi:MAG: hypothetical protein KIT77_06280 [Caldilinea sp.]|nr:hypothetical protein [Caldilineaceae bacterium]MCW5840838.1 hypothetical protein [Caldilinea sp.]